MCNQAKNFVKLFNFKFPLGECITVQGRDCEADEIPEIVARLHAVTTGCGTRELSLRRNAVGQLGFHVQPVRISSFCYLSSFPRLRLRF